MAHRLDRTHLASVFALGFFFLLSACGSGFQLTTGPAMQPSAIDTCADEDIRIERVIGSIDGVVIMDSSRSSFSLTEAISLRFKGIAPGAHHARVEAYGRAGEFSGVLYRGSGAMEVSASVDPPQPVALDWVGPGADRAKINVTLGRVGTVKINATFPETICD